MVKAVVAVAMKVGIVLLRLERGNIRGEGRAMVQVYRN